MAFPGAGAHVYYNEVGEPLGWDGPGYDDEDYDPDDLYDDRDEDDDEDADGEEDEVQEAQVGGDDSPGEVRYDHDEFMAAQREEWDAEEGLTHQHIVPEEPEVPEPREPDDSETSWQEYGRAEAYNDAEMARYDDDPNPHEGTYSEM